MATFDTIIIGAGPGGNAAAYALAARQKVLVVENDLFGGTCPNRGCDPKKMLYSGIEVRQQALHIQHFGLKGAPTVDWPALMAFKRAYTSQIPSGTESGLKKAGITTLHGQPHFKDAHTIQVDETDYTAQNMIIATGQKARPLDIEGYHHLRTSRDFLDLDVLPERLIFIGGGYISLELANIAAAAGAKVTVLHHNQRPLKQFPKVLVDALLAQMAASGVDMMLDTSPTALLKVADGEYILKTNQGDLSANLVINATGRIPNIEDLHLDDIGIAAKPQGILVNEYLQTSVANVYAVGDVVARTQPKLTPVAGFEGSYAARQILNQVKDPIQYPVIPTVVFSAEKLAQVGISVNTALANPDQYDVATLDVTHWYTYNRVKDPKALVLTVKNKQHEIVGIAALSTMADEVINLFTAKLNASAQGDPIYLYPTAASDLGYFE